MVILLDKGCTLNMWLTEHQSGVFPPPASGSSTKLPGGQLRQRRRYVGRAAGAPAERIESSQKAVTTHQKGRKRMSEDHRMESRLSGVDRNHGQDLPFAGREASARLGALEALGTS